MKYFSKIIEIFLINFFCFQIINMFKFNKVKRDQKSSFRI